MRLARGKANVGSSAHPLRLGSHAAKLSWAHLAGSPESVTAAGNEAKRGLVETLDADRKDQSTRSETGRFTRGRNETQDLLQRLDGSRRFTEALLGQIHSGVIAADMTRRITFANRSAAETLGVDILACVGLDLLKAFGQCPALMTALDTLAEGDEARVDVALVTGAGEHLDLGVTLMRTSGLAPTDMAYVLLFRDIGDQRRFDSERRRVERVNAIGNLVAALAHEIRNPLAGLQALAESLLIELPDGDRRHEYPMRMLTQVARMEQFLRAAVQFGEPRPAQRVSVAAESVVHRACGAMSLRWGAGTQAIEPSVEPALPSVLCDPAQIVEALMCLIENAVEAAGESTRAEITVRSTPAQDRSRDGERVVQIDVIDDGPGVPEPLARRIFDPFFTTKARGIGLGLSQAEKLVRENGGRIRLESSPGRRTVFSVFLPEAPR